MNTTIVEVKLPTTKTERSTWQLQIAKWHKNTLYRENEQEIQAVIQHRSSPKGRITIDRC